MRPNPTTCSQNIRITKDELQPFFVDEHWSIKDCLDDFITVCSSLDNNPLHLKKAPSQGFLVKISHELNAKIKFSDQLRAFSIAMEAVWRLYMDLGFNIDPPVIRLLLPKEKPYPDPQLFSAKQLTNLINALALGEGVFAGDQHGEARLYLALAFESSLLSPGLIHDTVTEVCSSLIEIASTKLQCLPIRKGRVERWIYLGPLSILLLKNMHLSQGVDAFTKRPQDVKKALDQLLEQFGWSLTIDDLLSQLGAMDRAVDQSSLLAAIVPLERSDLIGALTGRYSASTLDEPERSPAKVREWLKQELLTTVARDTDGFKQRNRNILQKVRRLLQDHLCEPDTRKRSRRLDRLVLDELEGLISQTPLSQYRILLAWIHVLIESGSGYKERLRASSIAVYFSTCHAFLKDAFDSRDLFEVDEQTRREQLQSALDVACAKTGALDVIRRFLKFAFTVCPDWNVSLDEYELSSTLALTRAHYIPPRVFDEVCQDLYRRYTASASELLALQLTYYCGLRHNELLSLRWKDISFEARMLYISADKVRKSSASVRKIPLCLIPSEVEENLRLYREHVNLLTPIQPHQTIFNRDSFELFQLHFLNEVRQRIMNPELVLHSLRHSCANNWLFMFEALSHHVSLAEDKKAPYFLQHELFSDQHLVRVRQQYQTMMTVIRVGFPVLTEVAIRLGHRSPAVTVSSYLHLLDLSLFLFALPRLDIERHKPPVARYRLTANVSRDESPGIPFAMCSGFAEQMRSAKYGAKLISETHPCIAPSDLEVPALTFAPRPASDFYQYVIAVSLVLSNVPDRALDSQVVAQLLSLPDAHSAFLSEAFDHEVRDDLLVLCKKIYERHAERRLTVKELKALREVSGLLGPGKQNTAMLITDKVSFKRLVRFWLLFANKRGGVRLRLENLAGNAAKGDTRVLTDWKLLASWFGIELVFTTSFDPNRAFGVRLRPHRISKDVFERQLIVAYLFSRWLEL